MVLHIRKLTVDDAVAIISETVQKPAFQATAQSRKLVENLALAARVKAALVEMAPRVHTEADGSTVYIYHVHDHSHADEIEKIKTAAEQVEGVSEVIVRTGVQQEQHDHVNPFHNIG